MPDFKDLLKGKLTYLSGLGMVGMGAYLMSQGNLDTGVQLILNGLAAFGVRRAIGNL